MADPRHPKVGDVIVFHDDEGKPHNALVTVYWGNPTEDYIGCLNLVMVSGDESRKDQYGRQVERVTSIMHKSNMHVHGNYWRWPDEEPNPYQPPSST